MKIRCSHGVPTLLNLTVGSVTTACLLVNISRLIHLEEYYLEGRRTLNYTEGTLRAAGITAAGK